MTVRVKPDLQACQYKVSMLSLQASMNVKQFARMGGRARAKALSAERRREIAKSGGKASALKRKQGKTLIEVFAEEQRKADACKQAEVMPPSLAS
jgi:general stress protein YciG